uniref:MIF4G domain-containing protein n=1 Tax=Stomoxys calcitrans TaxID=35570 RepID=A0A1I8PK85_STOCA
MEDKGVVPSSASVCSNCSGSLNFDLQVIQRHLDCIINRMDDDRLYHKENLDAAVAEIRKEMSQRLKPRIIFGRKRYKKTNKNSPTSGNNQTSPTSGNNQTSQTAANSRNSLAAANNAKDATKSENSRNAPQKSIKAKKVKFLCDRPIVNADNQENRNAIAASAAGAANRTIENETKGQNDLKAKSNGLSDSPKDNTETSLAIPQEEQIKNTLNTLNTNNFDTALMTIDKLLEDSPHLSEKLPMWSFEIAINRPKEMTAVYLKFLKDLLQAKYQRALTVTLTKQLREEFETHVKNPHVIEDKMKPLIEELNACTDVVEHSKLQTKYEDQLYLLHQRGLAVVRFLGEMYKLQLLTRDRVFYCIESLLEVCSNEKLEYMCELLTCVGYLLDNESMTKPTSGRIEKVFDRIKEILQARGSNEENIHNISSPTYFMLQAIVDMRQRAWDQTTASSGAQNNASTSGLSSNNNQAQQQYRNGGKGFSKNRRRHQNWI